MFILNKRMREVSKELKQICRAFSKNQHVKVVLDRTIKITDGETDFNNYFQTKKIKIGIKGIKTEKDPEYVFVQAMIILYHELQHVEQNNQIWNETATPEFFYNALATAKNGDYYLQNYNYDLRELDANYVGIHMAYERIKKEYPEINTFENVKKYMLNHSFFRDYVKEIEKAEDMEDLDKNIFEVMAEEFPFVTKKIERCTFEVSKDHQPDEFLRPFTNYCNENNINYPDILARAKGHSEANFFSDKVIGTVMLGIYPKYQELAIKNGIPIEPLNQVLNEFSSLEKSEMTKE